MCDDKVVSLDDHRPHSSGHARCLHCQHEWQAVSPVGYDYFQCPQCELHKGIYVGLTIPPTVMICAGSNCESYFFAIDPCGPICILCGTRTDIPVT